LLRYSATEALHTSIASFEPRLGGTETSSNHSDIHSMPKYPRSIRMSIRASTTTIRGPHRKARKIHHALIPCTHAAAAIRGQTQDLPGSPGLQMLLVPALAPVCRCCSILGRTVFFDCSPGTVLRTFPYHRKLTIRKQYLFPRRDGGLAILTAVARDGSDRGTGHATRKHLAQAPAQ
jgi:hypothetical protein